ncbi:MAG: hypothetical protein OEQ18_06690 [Gammaproteobacteria bacterium]|nr:hypothetical protein [Gammaproteobacteria bacterium]
MNALFPPLKTVAPVPFARRAAVGLSAWFVMVFVLAAGGAFVTPPNRLPFPTLAAIVLPLVVFALAFAALPDLRRFVHRLDPRDLILVHSFRMVGLVFIVLYFYGHLPGSFAWPAGLGDAVTAVVALVIGTRLRKGQAVSRNTVWWWNTFGLMDFAVAVSAGVLTRSGTVAGGISSETLATFPLALIPTFVVPFYIITHGIIYLRLREHSVPDHRRTRPASAPFG